MNLIKNAKFHRVITAQAAATTDVNSDSVDMQGFESVVFGVSFGTITSGAVTSVKAQGSDDDSSWSDLSGATVTVADTYDNQTVLLEVVKPLYRYVRCVVDRGTQNAVIDDGFAIQHGLRVGPVTHDASIAATTLAPVAARSFANS